MKLNIWESGIEKHLPALELFLKNVLLRKCSVAVREVASENNEDTVGRLEDSAIIIRAVEENFETEVLFGFSSGWLPLLAKIILDVDGAGNDEITRDLFREFITNLLDILQASFKDIGIQLAITEIQHIKSGQLSRSLNLKEYLTATFDVEQKFSQQEEQEQKLVLVTAMAQPNEDRVEMLEVGFEEENPFLTGEFEKISSRYAGDIDLDRVDKNTGTAEEETPAGSVKVKGKTVEFENFDKSTAVKNSREVRNINMLKNVEMNLSVELGRREMSLGKILKLVKGSVIELEKLAGEPVEILVNGHTIAQGDVVVIDEHFGVRLSNLIATQENLKELG